MVDLSIGGLVRSFRGLTGADKQPGGAADFASVEAPWLVAVFTSATCSSCADVQAKVEVLRSDDVGVDVIEYQSRRDLHQRYRIDSVPLVVIADDAGVVREHFLGPVTATDLWAAIARLRDA